MKEIWVNGMVQQQILELHILPVLPAHISAMLKAYIEETKGALLEIRLRVNQPIMLVYSWGERFLQENAAQYYCSRDDINKTLQLISNYSLYAYEQEIKMGFITIQGGHRVGIAGQTITDNGCITAIKNIGSINIRVAREVIGCADNLFSYIIDNQRICSTLIIAPPRSGKTTILRDLIRLISKGKGNFTGAQIGLVDERSEIAACQNGVPTVNLGPRVDVLDSCPKAKGMLMLIRSMAPAVVATDELGREEDVYAVSEALNAGISVLATVHGRNIMEATDRPHIGALLKHNYFERYIVLSDKPKVGTVETIVRTKPYQILYEKRG